MTTGLNGTQNHAYQIYFAKYHQILLNPLPERCALLTQLLLEAPLKELHSVFSSLVESIFGFHSGMDWGLLSLDPTFNVKEFDAVKRFLSPDGPVLKLMYKFIEDVCSSLPKFEFPVSCLPNPSKLMLREGKVPALYANKLQAVSPGQSPMYLQLNAFEYYFFHFGYFIVNPSIHTTNCVNQQDTLYAHILEDYLRCFLPTDGRAVPLFQSAHNIQHSPVLTSALSSSYGSPHGGPETMFSRSLSRPDCLTPVRQKPSLLKRGAVMMVSSPNSPCGIGSSQAECWKSETFLLVLKEMYLNQVSFEHQNSTFDLTMKVFVPSHYHVWMVRILIKHLHFFFNSALTSSGASGHGQIMIDTLGRLKCLGMTQLVQKEVYCFLKSTFDHWPLDTSFRVPLETWLSYIQPWRYVQADLEFSTWQKFIAENVLFYTSLFIQVLRRFLRMDFNCPKNAFMLFRATKVFSSTELREIIMQAEKGLASSPSSLNMSTPYIHRSPEKSFSYRKLSHLNGPAVNYVPLFSEQVLLMVSQLLSAVASASDRAGCTSPTQASKSKSFLSKMIDMVFDTSDDSFKADEISEADVKKISVYLNASIQQLCTFFREVSHPVRNVCDSTVANPEGSSWGDSFRNWKLSPNKLFQMATQRKVLDVTFNGNPDHQPVRTYEIAKLVTWLNELSQQLNEKHGPEIVRLYHSPTILGKVGRKILKRPVTYYNVIKSKDMLSVSRTPVHLPPRVHLRFLANKYYLSYFFAVIFVAYCLGYNPVIASISLVFIIAVSVFLSAIVHSVPIETKSE